ncbi:Murein L,D-transpeptidase YcbB/YkuD [Devosia sp. YR412]|uniref:L,D-transpeptidase family protein n=1 Tax=Devosia sp. YR412 TaxID=1881030 RepID=UPI0008AAED8A|nr:L,D-transpeptidase family protein [Devosia sp. YR412]SEQ14592.1 Murein L,D-transpeptidase YcbB/YkuD [Devosia sp. YR412]
MNKILVSLVAVLAGIGSVLPAMAQEVTGLAASPVIIAPPQTPLAETIKQGLSAAYNGARQDSAAYTEAQRLYFFYGARHFEPIWLSTAANGEVAFSESAQKILKLFERAESEGLRPSDYLTPDLDPAAAKGDPLKLAALETAFSGAALRYATHIYTGRIIPSSVDANLDIQPKKLDDAALLVQLATSPDPVKVLAALEPTHPEFLALKAALATFDDSKTDRPAQIATGPSLKPGMSDPRVPALRARLKLEPVDGLVYDDAIVEAMKAFQATQSLDVDGVMGPATLTALNGGVPVTKSDIIANMERWRWMPRDLGQFNVFVNIPEFRLAINRDGAEEYTTRVVVGTTKNQTPVFSDNIRHVVVNPYWNVPSSIIKGEIAPAVLRDPGYTDSHNMDLLYNGEPVSPWQVNWNMVSNSNFPFRVRQRPGPGNSLGQIKFLFPNKHDVYLHDTPSKSLFSRSGRAFSHGCVRVENPMEFAGALMANEANISRASLEAMFGPNEKWVNPDKQIPVHIAYFTLRPNADGTLQSYGDIYGHNAKLIAAMGLSKPAIAPEIIAEVNTIVDDLSP